MISIIYIFLILSNDKSHFFIFLSSMDTAWQDDTFSGDILASILFPC